MADLDDAQLIERTLAGDGSAFDALVGRYRHVESIWEVMQAEFGFNAQRFLPHLRSFPFEMKEPIRWGFIGGWRRHGGKSRNASCSIYTNEMDAFFGEENADPELVARFASIFTNPKTVAVCRTAFREKQTREELKAECALDDEGLDEATKPLLDEGLAEWKEQDGIQKLCHIGHGFNFALTVIGLTKTWYNELCRDKDDG